MRYSFSCLPFFIAVVVSAMQIDVTVRNCTSETLEVRDFTFVNSLLESSTPDMRHATQIRVKPNNVMNLTFVPIAGEKRDFFNINIGKEKITVWWNFVLGKGYGPFLDQKTEKHRAIKRIGEAGSVIFDVVDKNSLKLSKSLAKDLMKQSLDNQDISDQTGFTVKELGEL
ncbi:MAG: hypothetical protein LBS23_00380 [Holosporaceae bacterium]|nr:hypothetical protein [Holosporaceae bacterium]